MLHLRQRPIRLVEPLPEGDADLLEALHPAEAEFGWPHWVFGGATYAFLDDGHIACIYSRDGVQHVAVLDPETGELIDVDMPHTAIPYPYLACGGLAARARGGLARRCRSSSSRWTSRALGSRSWADSGRETRLDEAFVSIPRAIEFPTEGGLTAFAHFYAPANRGRRRARRVSVRR